MSHFCVFDYVLVSFEGLWGDVSDVILFVYCF